MTDAERKLIEENMSVVQYFVKGLMKKYQIPYDKYDDYCQEGYEILCKKVNRYNQTTKFQTFAKTVLHHAFVDRYRKECAHYINVISLEQSVADDDEGQEASCAEFVGADIDIEREVLTEMTQKLIRDYISEAKEKYHADTTVKGFEALELKMQGYSGSEIAQMFQIPSNSLRAWMSRARAILLKDNSDVYELLHG